MENILIVDDDANIRKLISVNLEKRGYNISEAVNGKQAMSLLRQDSFDLVLLDMILPDMPGQDICSWIHMHSEVPVIVISILRDQTMKVRTLDAGAGDYLTKPFSEAELLARVRAVLRRTSRSNIHKDRTPHDKLQVEELTIDFETRRVKIGEKDIYLTKTEYAILTLLANQAGEVVDQKSMLMHIWGSQYRNYTHYLHIYVGRVRKKLGIYGDLLETIPNVGYRLCVEFS